ncbi:MAG: energy transducer TonB [Bryobacteraceae bacterium]
MISLALHAGLIAALLLLPFGGSPTLEKPVEPPLPPIRLHLTPVPAPDPGGGGTRSPIPPTKGQLPQFARQVFVPPVERTEVLHPLMMEPSIAMETPPSPLTLVQFGDPNGKPGPPSGGPGLNGIGNGPKGGLGDGDGPAGGGTYEALSNGPTTGPVPLYNPDPEFSEEARKAKLQGQVVLEVVVDTDGRAHRIRVREGLGLGLDEKAIQAVESWRFKPGHRNGRAIAVRATIYINFRLL